MAQYFKCNGLEIKKGNSKLSDDTLIFNMGPASCCPSKALGMCKVPDGHCYALKDEQFYGVPVVSYRLKQMRYWLTTPKELIERHFHTLFEQNRKALSRIEYLMFNESGDFWSQECVSKLNYLAYNLWHQREIDTWGFTARKDLDFDGVHFFVKGSGCDNGNNGRTMVITSIDDLPEGYKLCSDKCSHCTKCKEPNNQNIAFKLHS